MVFTIHGIEFDCSITPDFIGQIREFPEIGTVIGSNERHCLALLESELRKEWHVDKRSEHQFRVDVFMHKLAKLNGQKVRYKATDQVTDGERLLRAKLILEEVLELIVKGLGVSLTASCCPAGNISLNNLEDIEFAINAPVNLLEIADGTADVKVVVTGTQSCFGIDDLIVQEIVDFNNLSKFGLGYTISDSKKLIKAPGFVGPEAKLKDYLANSQGK